MNKRKIVNVLACCLSIFWSGAICFGYPGVMSTYWQQAFSVGPSETGLVVTFMLLALAVMMFFSGKFHMKYGMRICILIGTLFYAVSFLLLRIADNIYMVYVWAFLANLGCSFIYGPGLTTAQQAFPQKRGLVSGIVNLVFGISAAIMSPVLNRLLADIGYEKLNLLLLLFIVATNLLAMLLLGKKEQREEAAEEKHYAVSLNVSQAMKTKTFWLIWLMWAFMGAAGISMVSLAKSYAATIGIASVSILTAFNLANGLIRIVVGYLTDLIGYRITGMVAFVLAGIGYLILPHTSNLGILMLCAVFVGIGFGTLFTISGPMISKQFGLAYFGLIFGVIFTAYGLIGGVFGPAIAGVILARTNGNYLLVFTYLAVFALFGAGLMSRVKESQAERLPR